MPSIKNLEMAAAISAYNNISIRKSFFSTKVFYIPTQSPVKAIVQEYSLLEGKRLLQLLDMPIEQMITYIKQNGKQENNLPLLISKAMSRIVRNNFKLLVCKFLSDNALLHKRFEKKSNDSKIVIVHVR